MLQLLDKSIGCIKIKILQVFDILKIMCKIDVEVIIMICENRFCLYQENNECQVSHIELDITGLCRTCVYVDIEEKKLSKMKDEQIKRDLKRIYSR